MPPATSTSGCAKSPGDAKNLPPTRTRASSPFLQRSCTQCPHAELREARTASANVPSRANEPGEDAMEYPPGFSTPGA